MKKHQYFRYSRTGSTVHRVQIQKRHHKYDTKRNHIIHIIMIQGIIDNLIQVKDHTLDSANEAVTATEKGGKLVEQLKEKSPH